MLTGSFNLKIFMAAYVVNVTTFWLRMTEPWLKNYDKTSVGKAEGVFFWIS